ncbi:MAG TPA: asparagine synthase-related protein [Vicinamibacterales bacterium]|nr:asparagine synthase-related protein [Vicinamibacterales bacterium]
MTCVVAFADLSGAPAGRARLAHAAAVPPYDGGRVRVGVDGPIGLAAAPLPRRIGGFATVSPHGHGAAITVVFDGRLDERGDLLRYLTPRLWIEPATASDADLVLAAYLEWGLDAAAHLSGDFAWCLWDGRERRLLCARDHFGIRPLYYARTPGALAVSNAISSLQRAGVASDRLLDRAAGDLLLFGDPQEPADTMLADVRRVPPAHVLTWTPSAGVDVWAYWRFEPPAPSRERRPRDIAARFRDTLGRAVDDRLGDGEPATVMMSGGLDSTSLAALAAQRRPAGRVRALTSVHRTLASDGEERFAELAARSIGIPLDVHFLDGYELFDRWDADACPVLPMAEPLTAVMADLLDRASAHGDVALSGDGGDPLLLPATLPRHVGRMPPLDVAWGVWLLGVRYRRAPLLGLRSTWRRLRASEPPPPSWLAAPLRASYDADARRREVEAAARVEPAVLRRESVRQLRSPWWPSLFESQHPAATRRPVDVRYPFFDRRVVAAALALPSYPWCIGKTALREAMVGLLPEDVRRRPKTPLAFDPVGVRRRLSLDEVVRTLSAAPGLERFVDVRRLAATVAPTGLLLDAEPGTLAALSLALWLIHAPAARADRTPGAATATA